MIIVQQYSCITSIKKFKTNSFGDPCLQIPSLSNFEGDTRIWNLLWTTLNTSNIYSIITLCNKYSSYNIKCSYSSTSE